MKVIDQDIIFLSYDEPNAEENYADLLTKVPWAKRVHGVEGSDAAHKACADISETENFITVDGDTIIDSNFLKVELDFEELGATPEYQFSWSGKIDVNGLMYGNGSIKMWTRDFVKSMKTHENTDGSNETNIEFCYFDNYLQLNENFSTSIISSSPQQAWRAGFREGVKMSLNRGSTIKDLNSLWWQNYNRLLIWTMVGADVQNGLWTIYGAREGLYKTMCTDWDHIQVRDFTYLNQLWNNKQKTEVSGSDLLEAIEVLGQTISTDLQFPIAQMPLDEQQSKFFKTVHSQPSRNMRLKK
jgi:hypothetical protein|tara:strand:+ start:1198 stop:2094 length:897 start_codon:yes stop_codon:yes gene_type:complete